MTGSTTPDPIPDAITEWAEEIARALVDARVNGAPMHAQAGILQAGTIDPVIAYQVLVTLSRTVALVLRPAGHEGGPIGLTDELRIDPAYVRASQLIGFAAQADAGMVDALARAVLAAPTPLAEARTTLWAILEVLTTEPVTPNEKD